MRSQVAGEHLPVVDQGLVGGEQQHVAGAADFVQRVLQAQPGFQRDQSSDLVAAPGDDLARLHQDAIALVAGQRARWARATVIARRTSSTVAIGTVAMTSPLYG